MSTLSEPVTFRLSAEEGALLDAVAAKQGQSRGEYSRDWVRQQLHQSPGESVAERLTRIEEEQAQQSEWMRRHDTLFRLAIQVLLCDAGRAEPHEAEQFVRENLN